MKKAIIFVLAIVAVLFLLAGLNEFTDLGRGVTTQYTEKKNIGAIQNIDIDIMSANVNFVESDTYGYKVDGDRRTTTECTYQNGKLVIKQKLVFSWDFFDFTTKNTQVDVYLPSNAKLDSLDVNAASGTISMAKIKSNNLNATVTSGEIDIVDTKTNVANANTTSGNINISNFTANQFQFSVISGGISAETMNTGSLKGSVTSGHADFQGVFKGNNAISVTSGNLVLNIDGKRSDYNRTIKSQSGSVLVDGLENSGSENYNKARNNLDIHVISGDAKVNFSNE